MADATKTYTMTDGYIRADKIDGLSALIAANGKRLATERFDCPIYSFDYGLQTYDLLGNDSAYVLSELRRRLKECLLEDDRNLDVRDFKSSTNEDKLLLAFIVDTIYGAYSATKEV